MVGALFSKSLIQFSVDGWSCVPSLLFDLRPNYGEGNEENGNLLKNIPCTQFCTQCPQPGSRPPLTCVSIGDSRTLTGKPESVYCGVTAPFSWVLVHTKFDYALQESVSQSCVLAVLCGINGDLQRGLIVPRSADPEPLPLWRSPADPYLRRRHSNTVLAQSLWGLWVLVHTRYI